jgi:hypothetical protein
LCEAAELTERYFYESFASSEALLITAYDDVSHRLLHCLERIRASTRGRRTNVATRCSGPIFRPSRTTLSAPGCFVLEIACVGPAVD